MGYIFLVHWKEAEGRERLETLRASGFKVAFKTVDQSVLRELRNDVPDAVVIDLNRLPSHGRDIGMGLRSYKATRHVPLVFVGGDAEKVDRIKKLLPDAVYTNWNGAVKAIWKAIANPVTDPVVPKSVMDAYTGVVLAKKLGIKADQTLTLLDAPAGFVGKLDQLPSGLKIRKQLRGKSDLVIWFAKSQSRVSKDISKVASYLGGKSGLWIAWPKKTSGLKSDLTQPLVRKIGLASGLVDHKICAIDDTWSALRFVKRGAR
jgi:CheY-like chemotaxis protein